MSNEQPTDREMEDCVMHMTEQEKQEIIHQMCKSKSDEFARMGYDNITPESIWSLVSEGYKESLPPIHQWVNDIFSLKINKIMNRYTMDMYKQAESDNPFHR